MFYGLNAGTFMGTFIYYVIAVSLLNKKDIGERQFLKS